MFGALVAMTMRDDSFIILRTRYAGARPVWSGWLIRGAFCNVPYIKYMM